MKAYLAGPIFGCSDEEAVSWRVEAARFLALRGHRVLDPMARDYRGQEAQNVRRIVEGDKNDIQRATVLLVNASRASWGTAMEVLFAWEYGVPVYAFTGAPPASASPWLLYHADGRVFETLEEALERLVEDFDL